MSCTLLNWSYLLGLGTVSDVPGSFSGMVSKVAGLPYGQAGRGDTVTVIEIICDMLTYHSLEAICSIDVHLLSH